MYQEHMGKIKTPVDRIHEVCGCRMRPYYLYPMSGDIMAVKIQYICTLCGYQDENIIDAEYE